MRMILIWFVLLSAVKAEEDQKQEQQRQELISALTNLYENSGDLPGGVEKAQRELLKTWSVAQIEALATWDAWVNGTRLSDLVLQEWGERAGMDAIQYFLDSANQGMNKHDRTQRSVSGPTPHEAFLGNIYLSLEQVFIGWSRKDAKAAWAKVADRKGPTSQLLDTSGYGHRIARPLFASLASVDPGFAMAEFQKDWNPHYRGAMLQGMAKGLPVGYDWKGLFETVLQTRDTKNRYVLWPLRGSLLARWMQDNVKEALDWFRSEAGKSISLAGGKQVSLQYALRHWLSNDLAGATRWLKAHPEMVGELLEEETWLDPDDLSQTSLRQMIADALPLVETLWLPVDPGHPLRSFIV